MARAPVTYYGREKGNAAAGANPRFRQHRPAEWIPMFDDQTLAAFRTRLLQLREEVLALEKSSEEAGGTVHLDQARVGRLSRMDALQGQAMSLATRERRRIEVQKIDAALRRMEQGEYGYCVNCGEEIAMKRLELDPAAPLCIDCAGRSESPGKSRR